MSAAIAITFDCEHCEDRKRIQHPELGDIRCPRCNPRKRKADPSGLALLSQREAERREQAEVAKVNVRQLTGIEATIGLLCQWGRRVRDRGIGYPSHAAHESLRSGGRGDMAGLPPDLEAVDRAVALAPVDFKAILVEHYTKDGYNTEKAAHLGISRKTYYQRKASAERHIATAIGM